MAENKKAFVVYTDWKKYIDDLNDTQIGKWTRWMFEYCNDKWKDKNDEIEYPKDTAVKMLCLLTKDILKRDLKKYEEKKNRLLKNGKQYRTDIDTKSSRNQTDINTDIGTDIDTEIETVNSNKLLVNSNKLLEESKDSNIKENTTTINSSIKEKSAKSQFSTPTHKFGEYGRVVLNQEQYDKLVSEYNKDYIDKMIKALDEYVQSNNNKNKYKDFNLVLRKAIRENWFNIVDESDNGGFRML